MNPYQRAMKQMLVLSVMVLLTMVTTRLQAQSTSGSILGTVTDSSGASVPNATVTVMNLGTSESRTIKSDAGGNYNAVNLTPASYKVTVEATNFKRMIRQPIQVTVGASVRVDALLEIGAASETVEVSTQAPLLQTDSGTMSTQVEGQTVQEMPLNGRNTMNLLSVAAGVVPQGSTSGGLGQNQGQGHTMVSGFSNYQIGGGLAGQNAAYIDGAPINTMSAGLASNVLGLVMTQDAVQEFSVVSNSVSAEFGRFAGGVINMASKGGTNKIRGSVYEYFRNAAFNANDWFLKKKQLAAGAANKPVQWNQNQYGVSVGGPIVKDKLFYQFTWEGFRSTTAQPTATDVPGDGTHGSVNMQAGNVSGNILSAVTPYCAAATYDTTNNVTNIPSSCWDPMAAVIKTYYPGPNQTGIAVGKNNYLSTPSTPNQQQQYNARVDYMLSNNQRLFGRYTHWGLKDAPQAILSGAGGWKTAKSGSSFYSDQAVLGDTITISPKTILDLRLSWLKVDSFSSQPESLGQTYEKFAGTYLANSSVANALTGHVLPVVTFSGGKKGYNIYGVNVSNGEIFSTNQAINASLIRTQGNHSLKFGTELRQMIAQYGPGGNAGSLGFNGNVTGDEWADFLLGRVNGNGSSLSLQSTGKDYNRYMAFFVTDTWQATRRLTLNMGLRYEIPGGFMTKGDTNSVLLPGITDSAHTDTAATIALVNSPLYTNRSSFNLKNNLFSPRLGLAYRIDNDTTIRGGYGLSFLAIDTATTALSQQNPVNSATTTCANATMYNCFTSVTASPGRTTLTTGQSLIDKLNYYNNTSANISLAVPYQRVPYAQQWNLAVGRQFAGEMLFEISYLGSKANFLPYNGGFQLNQIPAVYDNTGKITSGAYTGFALSDTTVNRCGVFGGKNLSAGQCMRAYPHLGSLKNGMQYHGSINYHALIVKGEKRFGSTGRLMGNLSWSKQIGDTDTSTSFLETATTASGFGTAGSVQNYYDLKAEHAVLSYDVPMRGVVTYIVTLPFGKGQKWGSGVSGVSDHLISGWGVSGISTFQHGFHIPVQTGGSWALKNSFGSGTIRPNYTAGCNKTSALSGNDRVAQWFNTSCFTQPGGGSSTTNFAFGNQRRVDANLFAQGKINFDFTALKSTKITDRTNVQFRAEFFNLFNRKQFSPPDAQFNPSAASPTFGQILSSNSSLPRLVQFSLRVNF